MLQEVDLRCSGGSNDWQVVGRMHIIHSITERTRPPLERREQREERGRRGGTTFCFLLPSDCCAVIYLSSFDCEAMERPRSREIDDPPVELSGPAQMIAGGGAG